MRMLITDRCRLWNITAHDRYIEARISSGRKVKEDSDFDKTKIEHGIAKNGYVYTSLSFVRFVGHAAEKAKNLEEGARITNIELGVNLEPYWDDKNQMVGYPRNPQLTVYNFEEYVYEGEPAATPETLAAAEPEQFEDELPF